MEVDCNVYVLFAGSVLTQRTVCTILSSSYLIIQRNENMLTPKKIKMVRIQTNKVLLILNKTNGTPLIIEYDCKVTIAKISNSKNKQTNTRN